MLAAILNFAIKKLETVFFVFSVIIESKKSQVSRFYMNRSLNHTTTYTTWVQINGAGRYYGQNKALV